MRHPLEEPFFVLATQNPIEMEGTYPLPEAQLDRFMFNVVMDYLPEDEEVAVVQQTTAQRPPAIEPLFTGEDVLRFHELVRQMPIAQDLIRYAVRLAAASRPQQPGSPAFINDWVSWGAGTRAGQSLVLGAKARALLQGRTHVSTEDIRVLAAPVLRHRVLVNYRAEAEGVNVETLIRRLLDTGKEAGPRLNRLCLAATSTASSSLARERSFADPKALMAIRNLELRARVVVEGFWKGLHRSPYHGFSVEFTEYRQYSPGDDTRYLDWRLYARSDRHYLKRFEDETNLRCHLLVDQSRSMDYGSLTYSKSDYVRTLAATLAWFLHGQGDAVGLLTFDERVRDYLPPRHRHGHLRQLMLALEHQPEGRRTNLSEPLRRVAELARKRGLIVLLSDLLTPLDELERSLARLTAAGHEVVLWQTLDPNELAFAFQRPTLFQDLESQQDVYVDPEAVRSEYQRRLAGHCRQVEIICQKLGAAFHRLVTDQPLELALVDFLRGRSRRNKLIRRRGSAFSSS